MSDFTPEQQAAIDASLGKRFAEIQAKAEAKFKEELAAIEAKYKAQLAAKETDLAAAVKAAEGGGKADDNTALLERVKTLEADKVKSAEMSRKSQLLAYAAELGAVSGEQVAVLMSPYIKLEDGILSVINAEGQKRVTAEGKPMTAKEAMTEFLAGNPHLVRAAGNTGAGSRSATGSAGVVKTMNRGDYNALSPQLKMDYVKSGGSVTD